MTDEKKKKKLFDEAAAIAAISAVMFPYLLEGFTHGISIGAPLTPSNDIMTAAVHKAIKAYAFKQSKYVTDTTSGKLKELLQTSYDQGWSEKKLAAGISELFDSMAPYRAKAIARTEMTSVINDGTMAALGHEGYTEKEWSTIMDGRERPSHESANGQIVPINEPFHLAGGEGMRPGDPSLPPSELVNCRCSVVGAGTPETRKATLQKMFLRIHGSLEGKLVIALHREFERERRSILLHLLHGFPETSV